MALPASWTLVPVTATYLRRDGSPATGRVLFRSAQIVVVDDVIVVPRTIVATLDAIGSISVHLPATDDEDIDPTGWTYTVDEQVAGLNRDPWSIQVPHDSDGIDLSTAAPATPVDQVTDQLTTSDLGVTVARQSDLDAIELTPGPQGPAGQDGTDGADGASAYEVAVANGFVGNEAAWLASLVGEQGPQGPQGIQGEQGEPGQDGADADTVDLVATPSAVDSPAATIEGHPDGSTGDIARVRDPIDDRTILGVTRFSVNSNVPIGAPFLSGNNGMRLYFGVSDPDPTAPDDISVWMRSDGVVLVRTAGEWVPAA